MYWSLWFDGPAYKPAADFDWRFFYKWKVNPSPVTKPAYMKQTSFLPVVFPSSPLLAWLWTKAKKEWP